MLKGVKALIIVLLSAYYHYAFTSIIEVGGNYEDSLFDNIKDSDFCLLILISFTLPILFFTITFFVKKPIKWYFKITYLGITIGMFFIYFIYSFVIEFASIIKTNLTPNYPYVIGYVNLVFIIAFWCLLLGTPLSKYKFFNWPFEQREDKKIDQNE